MFFEQKKFNIIINYIGVNCKEIKTVIKYILGLRVPRNEKH